MTLIAAQKIVLNSLTKEINSSFSALYNQLENGLILSSSAKLVADTIDELENTMNYLKVEFNRLNQADIRALSQDLESIWRAPHEI